jgi:ABC-type antimicrobial peptide transport system permease subunit
MSGGSPVSSTASQGSGGGNLKNGLTAILSAIASFFVVGFVISLFVGGPFLAGIFGGLDQAIFWAVLLFAVAYVGYFTDNISIAFVLTAAAALFA